LGVSIFFDLGVSCWVNVEPHLEYHFRDLLLYEKTDILSGWTQLEYLLALCRDDPTHSDGGMM